MDALVQARRPDVAVMAGRLGVEDGRADRYRTKLGAAGRRGVDEAAPPRGREARVQRARRLVAVHSDGWAVGGRASNRQLRPHVISQVVTVAAAAA